MSSLILAVSKPVVIITIILLIDYDMLTECGYTKHREPDIFFLKRKTVLALFKSLHT